MLSKRCLILRTAVGVRSAGGQVFCLPPDANGPVRDEEWVDQTLSDDMHSGRDAHSDGQVYCSLTYTAKSVMKSGLCKLCHNT